VLVTAASAALAIPLSGSGGPASPRQDFFADIGVVLPPTSSTRRPYCLDSTARWPFQVVLRQLPDVPFNAQGAMVTVDGSDGRTWSQEAGPGGRAVIEWPMEQEGLLQLTVQAQMGNSTSPAEHFTVQVVPCYWEFQIRLTEEYDLSEDESITVGAEATASGGLRRVETNSEPGSGSARLELVRAGGSFSLSASDTLEPLDVFLDPEVNGSISLELHEGLVGPGQLSISLIGTASGLPQMTNLGFEDVTEQGNEIYVSAPVPTSAGIPGRSEGSGFDPIERMQLATVTLPDTGGVMETSPDMVFIQSSDRIRSSATFTLFRGRETPQW
jgi:hypothetical protein